MHFPLWLTAPHTWTCSALMCGHTSDSDSAQMYQLLTQPILSDGVSVYADPVCVRVSQCSRRKCDRTRWLLNQSLLWINFYICRAHLTRNTCAAVSRQPAKSSGSIAKQSKRGAQFGLIVAFEIVNACERVSSEQHISRAPCLFWFEEAERRETVNSWLERSRDDVVMRVCLYERLRWHTLAFVSNDRSAILHQYHFDTFDTCIDFSATRMN